MDYRHSFLGSTCAGRYFAVGIAWLFASLVGCVHTQQLPSTPTANVSVPVRKDADLPPRKPKASTCIAYGRFSEKSAADARSTPAQRQEMLEQARRAYQQALQIEPKNYEALVCLIRVYTTVGDHARAVASYRQALEAYPKA